MNSDLPRTALQLLSQVEASGEVRLYVAETLLEDLQSGDVCIRVEATPINPSDMGVMFAGADLSSVRREANAPLPALRATIPATAMPGVRQRVGRPMPTGLEGAGVVIAAGNSPAATQLLGRTVALMGGGMHAQYKIAKATDCLVLPEDIAPRQAASCFVNPLTALGMVETMRREGHRALVHTAAASSLGQMLNRICLADGIGLVCIVRTSAQEQLLREAGAKHVCNSSAPDFVEALVEALTATGATIAFDATGGGTLAGQILAAMEAAIQSQATGYNRYGTAVHKQLYFYGGLDPRPVEFRRTFGMAWGMGGWLLNSFLTRIGREAEQRLKDRIAAEVLSTFATHYADEISLTDVVDPSTAATYGSRATGRKFLVVPTLPMA